MKKIGFATPTIERPHPAYIAAFEASIPVLEAAGIDAQLVFHIGSAYISHARSVMLHKVMAVVEIEILVFIDHDLSWKPRDLLKLIETPDDVVAGTYRFKQDEEEYMATVYCDDLGRPQCRRDGCMKAESVPAGFLKVTRRAVEHFARAYPELLYGAPLAPHLDLFNHGAHKGTWWGEDYAFCRRWRECGGTIWLVPDLNIAHHAGDRVYPGNFHEFMLRQEKPSMKAA